MQTPSNFKHDFLKHLLSGLHAARESSRGVSLIEREKQIKLLADAAMALARGHGANWSRAIIAGSHGRKKIMKKKSFNARLKVRKKGFHSPSSWKVMPSVLARRIVKKRTQVLKRIIPGAESLDGISLLNETLDYVVYLRAQANIMQRITRVFGI
ncbi:uncharacterized protein LOC110019129 isoform X3 [Phalaenopsis equestris]|uniref:uncharacterized protein LOC110019129 isoform X3 n=1 Tax=Phalaenopsis equestris TaxID=78828 RepID=UPI0009E27CCA|nr:uncharacterized protein LOC110019129 isoform X3 [Phalaenopsis equestris]